MPPRAGRSRSTGLGGRKIADPGRVAGAGVHLRGELRAARRGFRSGQRVAASIELALGAAALLTVAAACFDLYSRVKADTAVARMAVVMADYVSHDVAPDGDKMKALGRFLQQHELGVPADVVFVISAIHQPPGDPQPEVRLLWSDDAVRIGDSAVTTALVGKCARRVEGDPKQPKLPAEFTPMRKNEVVIVAEVCARLTARAR